MATDVKKSSQMNRSGPSIWWWRQMKSRKRQA